MKKKLFKLFAGLLSVSLLATTCFAADSIMPRDVEYMSAERETTYKGVTYTAYSSVYVGDDYRAGIWVISDTELTAGGMDARAILYNEDGDVLIDSGWEESEAGLRFHYAVTDNVSSNDIVVAYGEYKVYSTTGQMLEKTSYVDSTGKKIENFSSTRAAGTASYDTTKDGETYGSLMMAGQIGCAPELISAIGTDGTKGYVKKSDFDPEFFTQAARKAYTESLKENNMIPLYDLNGNVIGQYEMGAPSDEPETDPLILEKIQQLMIETGSEKREETEEAEVQSLSYAVTECGETYGKLPDVQKIGYYPDLISVVGENGVKGYVYSENFEVCNVPEEGMTVSVYDLSGAVVDEFTFKCCNDWSGIRFPK